MIKFKKQALDGLKLNIENVIAISKHMNLCEFNIFLQDINHANYWVDCYQLPSEYVIRSMTWDHTQLGWKYYNKIFTKLQNNE